MYRVFIGYDPRQPIAYNIAQYSVVRNASKPVQITPLILNQLPITRRGLTEFTFSRFLVPYLTDFQGKSMFMDPDMIVTGDVCELLDNVDIAEASVFVVKDQPQFEWPSMMVFSGPKSRYLTPEYVQNEENALFDMKWALSVGELDPEWNHCITYQEPKEAKLYHYTAGLPIWPETTGIAPEEAVFNQYFRDAVSSVGWQELMGNSVHAEHLRKLRNDG